MPRGIKKIDGKEGTDFSITDAIKRKKQRFNQLEAAGKNPNEHDVMNDVLEEDEPETIKNIFKP